MTAQRSDSNPNRDSLIGWLGRLNTQVSQWASSMSWWRLIVLFLVILVAGAIIEDLLHLKHDKVRIAGKEKDVLVTIGGRDGIKIMKGPNGNSVVIPAHPPKPPVPAPPGATPAEPPAAAASGADEDSASNQADGNDEEDTVVGQQIITARGILGDIAGVVMVVLFAYLAAAKIVVRKVAQADAKVRTAVDAAEREAMERQLVQARLQVLQAQVEPHFLFNTLSAVDYLIETEPPRASRMQKALITYLRGALPQMRQGSSTLGRELRLIRSYLELIKMRIEDRLEVEIAVPEGLETAEFPPMMLQSLVENAIKHGIEPKPDGGKVRVAAGVQNAQLWVEVSDTGVGVPDGELLDGPTSGTGIGLQNIRERLAVLYPGKSRLMLRSDPDTGTSVKISVPYQVGPDALAAEEGGSPARNPA
ncbi:MAG: sensor histidine kinase [Ramlibacter sp.]|nr:sensor histidine kinase [Ramlibacter sp.]